MSTSREMISAPAPFALAHEHKGKDKADDSDRLEFGHATYHRQPAFGLETQT